MTLSVLLDGIHAHRELTRMATRAEALGLYALYYADERFHRDAYVGLAACATATTRLRLGTAVTDPYTRHPAITASAIGSLQELSNGRAVLGMGAGAFGLANLHITRDRPAIAIAEAVRMIRALLAGERVEARGRVVSLSDGWMRFKPSTAVPIYVAADGPRTLRAAGRVADGLILPHCASPSILRERLAVAGERNESGQKHRVIARLDIAVSEDRAAALDAARVRMVRYLWGRYPDIDYLEPHGLALPRDLDEALRAAGPFRLSKDPAFYRPLATLVPDELIAPLVPAGTPEEVATSLARLLQSGADEIMGYLLTADGQSLSDALELLGREVLPRLRAPEPQRQPAVDVSSSSEAESVPHPWIAAARTAVRFGVALGPRADWTALVGFVREAEALGLDSYWHPDHPLRGTDCWTILAALGQATTSIRLGTLVVSPPYRHPVLVARMAADVDRITGGRFVLGIGAGDAPEEIRTFGADLSSARERASALEEALLIIRDLLREGRSHRTGRHFSADVERFEGAPVQQPWIPILVGGGGERLTLPLVARHADASNIGPHERMGGVYSPDDAARKLRILRGLTSQAGRPEAAVLFTYATHGLILVPSEAEGLRRLARFGETQRREFGASLAALTPEQAVDRYRRLVRAGIRYFIVGIRGDDRETLRLLATEVAPAVAREGAVAGASSA